MAIPFTLVFQIMRKRNDLPFNWMFLCFGAFIVACGSTHIMDIIVIWLPAYGAAAVIKAMTALASVPTAIILFRIAPRVVNLPTVDKMLQEQTLRLRAEASNEAKDRFIAMLSHELRTPLTPVTAGLEIVSDELSKLDGQAEIGSVREALQMIRQNVEMEKVLIDDLLDLSALKHGKLGLTRKGVDLNKLCHDSVRHAESVATEKGIELTVDSSPEVIVTGDEARLRQILNNLLSNALRHTVKGGQVRIGITQAPGLARLQVRDDGCGISAENLERIFFPFEQVNRRGTMARAGLGLGLSIAKALAESMGGSLTAESPGLGQGSTFTLELPAGGAVMRPELSPPPAFAREETSKPSLLLVDDHPDTLRALSQVLRRAGYVVQTAESFAQAEPLLIQCDVLISDIDLPDGSGCELMRRFKACGGRIGISVSGFGSEEDIRRTREAGFTHSLIKPIEISQLLKAIREFRPDLKATG